MKTFQITDTFTSLWIDVFESTDIRFGKLTIAMSPERARELSQTLEAGGQVVDFGFAQLPLTESEADDLRSKIGPHITDDKFEQLRKWAQIRRTKQRKRKARKALA